MIQITPQMQIWLAVEAVDLRRGIGGLARVCREFLKADPFSGALFVFRNKRATAIKLLVYDSQGFWLCQKRLSLALAESLPDLEPLCEPHATLLAEGAPPNQKKRASDFLRERL